MKLKTIGCVALMAVSTAALAQTTHDSHGTSNTTHSNSTMDPSMNGMDDMATPNGTAAPNSTMQPQ